MDRSQKADLVDQLKHVFSETSVVVVTRNHGLSVDQSTDLRNKMRDAGAQFKVAKNRLALIALEGSRYKPIGDLLKGPTALATSTDPVAAAKVAVDFAKTNDKLEIVGGAMGSRRSPPFPRSTSFGQRSSGSSRHPRARSLERLPSRARSWRGSSRPTGPRKPHKFLCFNAHGAWSPAQE